MSCHHTHITTDPMPDNGVGFFMGKAEAESKHTTPYQIERFIRGIPHD